MAITIKLDRERTLKYNVAASIAFKRVYGKGLAAVFMFGPGQPSEISVDDDCLTTVLWVGLIHEDRKLSRERTAELYGDLVDPQGGGGDKHALIEAISEAALNSGLFGPVTTEGKAPAETTTS